MTVQSKTNLSVKKEEVLAYEIPHIRYHVECVSKDAAHPLLQPMLCGNQGIHKEPNYHVTGNLRGVRLYLRI